MLAGVMLFVFGMAVGSAISRKAATIKPLQTYVTGNIFQDAIDDMKTEQSAESYWKKHQHAISVALMSISGQIELKKSVEQESQRIRDVYHAGDM